MPMLAKESTSIQGDVNPLPSFLESMRGGDRTNGEAAGENGDGGSMKRAFSALLGGCVGPGALPLAGMRCAFGAADEEKGGLGWNRRLIG